MVKHSALLTSLSNIDEKSEAESFHSRRARSVSEELLSTTESSLRSPITTTTTVTSPKDDGPSDELFRMVLGNKSNSVEKLLRHHSEEGSGVGGEGISDNSSETEISQYGQSMFYTAKDRDNCDGECHFYYRLSISDKLYNFAPVIAKLSSLR